MSDTQAIPVIDPVRQAQIDQRRANLATARATKAKNAAARTAPLRQAETRTAADVPRTAPEQAQRASAVRDNGPEVLTRVRRDERDSGWADLPNHRKKPGWDYQWVTIRVYNEPVDAGDMLVTRNAGWRAERAVDWPELCEPGTPDDAAIERRGQRLYARPQRLTDEARQEDLNAAYQQQRDKTMAAASGKSAVRGEEGIPTGRAVVSVPMEITVEGLAG